MIIIVSFLWFVMLQISTQISVMKIILLYLFLVNRPRPSVGRPHMLSVSFSFFLGIGLLRSCLLISDDRCGFENICLVGWNGEGVEGEGGMHKGRVESRNA